MYDVPMAQECWVRREEHRLWVSNWGQVEGPSGKILKPRKGDAYGHLSVHVWNSGSPYNLYVHRLVAESFIPNPEHFEIVAHWDGNPKNNRVTNLRWTDQQGNMDDMVRTGTRQRGEARYNAKLTQEQADEIRALRSDGISFRTLATCFQVSVATIQRVVSGKGW